MTTERIIKFSEFKQRGKGGWQEYKNYLAEKGALSPNLHTTLQSRNGSGFLPLHHTQKD